MLLPVMLICKLEFALSTHTINSSAQHSVKSNRVLAFCLTVHLMHWRQPININQIIVVAAKIVGVVYGPGWCQ